MAFEAAGFRDPDREILLAALLGELRVLWSQDEVSDLTHEAAILEHAMDYFALRDSGSRLKTATQIVNSYLAFGRAARPDRFIRTRAPSLRGFSDIAFSATSIG